MLGRKIAPDRAWGPSDPLAWGLLFSAWMLAHPYAGIRHDGIFYAADAMYRLDRSALGQDLFFLAGSPFDASVFGELYAAVIAAIGMVPASWTLYVGAQLIWGVTAIAWAARFLPARWFLVGAACLVLLPRSYGSGLVFKLAELQVTARSFAEPLALLALLALSRRRPAAGLALLTIAALVHPIMALPAIIAGGWLLMTQWRLPLLARACLAVVGFVLVYALAAAGTLGTMDGDWLETTRQRNPFILPSEWDLEYLARIGAPIVVLLAASRRLAPDLRQLTQALAIAAVSGLLLALIGGSQEAALLLQAQPWRASWVALWAAPFAAVAAAWSTWARARGESLMYLATVPSSLVFFYGSMPVISWLVLLHAAALGFWPSAEVRGRAWSRLGAAWLCVFLGLAVVQVGAVIYMLVARPEAWSGESIRSAREVGALWLGWVLAPAGLLLLRFLARPSARGRGIAVGAMAIGLATAVAMLDGRSAEFRQREAWIRSGLPQVRAAIGNAEPVFWPGRLATVWLALGRPSYVSMEQMAAQMFDRTLSEEGRRRIALIGALGGRDGLLDFHAVRNPTPLRSQPDAAAARRICVDRPGMALIMEFPIEGIPSERLTVDAGTEVWITLCRALEVPRMRAEGGA